MKRIITTIIGPLLLFISCSFGQIKTNCLILDAGPNLSYSDANTNIGYGVRFSYIRKLNLLNWKNLIGMGVTTGVDKLNGGKNAIFKTGTNDYSYNTTVYRLEPRIEGSIYLGQFNKIEINPIASLGITYIQASGQNLNQTAAQGFHNQFGNRYFTPHYSDENELLYVTTEQNTIAPLFSAGITLGYFIKHNFKIQAGPSLHYSFSDKLDGLDLPVLANKSNDMIMAFNLGLTYVYRTKPRYKTR